LRGFEALTPVHDAKVKNDIISEHKKRMAISGRPEIANLGQFWPALAK
jgi:hypothetical protein